MGPMDLHHSGDPFGSRSTSASSCQGAGRPRVGGDVDETQAEQVVKAMLPVVKLAMASPNRAVFQTALDSMMRIERMFGKATFDQHLDVLADALERQCSQPGGDARAVQVLRTMLSLCSDPAAESLRTRFPHHMAEVLSN